MKRLLGFILLFASPSLSYAQSPEMVAFFEKADYSSIVDFCQSNSLSSSKDLVMAGYAHYVLNMEQKGLDYLDLARVKGYKGDDLHLYRGLCLRYLNRFDEAELALNTFLTKEPGHVVAQYELGMIAYFRQDLPKAASIFKELASMAPPHPGALYMRGHVAHVRGNFEEALVLLYAAAKVLPEAHPFHARAWLDVGSIELGLMQRPEKAADAFEKAIPAISDIQQVHKALRANYGADRDHRGADFFRQLQELKAENRVQSEWFDKEYLEIARFNDFPESGMSILVHQYWKTPVDLTDKWFRVEVVRPESGELLRVFSIEKNMALFDSSPDYLILERPLEGGAIPYGRGWKAKDLSMFELRQAIADIWSGRLGVTTVAGARNLKAHNPMDSVGP